MITETSIADTATDAAADAICGTSPAGMTVAEALNLPALCGPQEMARLWSITPSQFHKLNKKGTFDVFKTKPAIGPRCFSGVLLGRLLKGEPLYVPSFGRKTRGA